jgi:tetratricopeptide (TPR) repeat protein
LVARLVGLPLRAVAGLRQNLLLAVVLLCGLTIIGIAGYSYAVHYSKKNQPPSTKKILAETLNAVNAKKLDDARHALAEIPAMAKLTSVEQAQTLYLMGRIVAYDAESHGNSRDARVLYLVAARYFEEARERGLPAKLEPDGIWQLGRCLFASGQYAECLPTLRASLKLADAHRYEINRMAALASLRATPANLKAAQQYSQAALEVPHLTTEQREETTLLNARILLQRHEFHECRPFFEQIPATSVHHGEALIGRAQSLLLEGKHALDSGEDNIDYEAARSRIHEALTILEPLQQTLQQSLSEPSQSELSLPEPSLSELSLPDQSLPDQSLPDQSLSEQPLPEPSLSKRSLSTQSLPEQSLSELPMPEPSLSKRSSPKRSSPKQALPEQTLPEQALSAAAGYLTGLCYLELGDREAATKWFDDTVDYCYSDPAAFAARLNLAEMLLESENYVEALTCFTNLVEQVPSPEAYDNAWVPLPELRERLKDALQDYLDANEYAAVLELCHKGEKILAADVRIEKEAEAHWGLGDSLLLEAETGPRHDSQKEIEARKHFREAGEAFSQLTTLRFAAPSFTDCLWKSGECYRLGQNFEAAIVMLRQFLEHAPLPKRPQGLVGLGEAQLSLGRHHEALQSLEECIVLHPKHPETYDARLLASQAYQELAQRRPAADAPDAAAQRAAAIAKAKQLLRDNLSIDDELGPSSEQFRKTKIAYGMLLYREGINVETSPAGVAATEDEQRKQELAKLSAANTLFQEAIVELGEAVMRYSDVPDDAPQVSLAQFQLAEAYLHAAKLPEASLKWEQTARGRAAMKQDRETLITAAADTLALLQNRLENAQGTDALSNVEVAVLRNTRFMYPDTLYALGKYEEAREAYKAAIHRYKDGPESLDALVQIAICERRLDLPDDARTTLQQAKVMLNRLKDSNLTFEKTTRYSRAEWDSLITWLAQL